MAISTQAQAVIKAGFNVPNTLATVASITQELNALRDTITQAEEALKTMKQDEDLLSSYVIPHLLARAGVKAYTLSSGEKIGVKEQVFASLPKTDDEAKNRALSWLNEHGGGGLIKDTVTVKSPDPAFIESLVGKYDIERKRDVNTNSLKAFLGELLGVKANSIAQIAPEEVPPELHCYVKTVTTISKE